MPGDPVKVDGLYGEGGGSVLRTALGLSAVTGRPVSVRNIRSNRPRPGLAAQHLTGLRALARLFGARIDGAELGSTAICFAPGKPVAGEIEVDVGTAGSIALMLQTLMIPLPFAGRDTRISLSGGTHVPWAPTVDYLANVTIPLLERMGCRYEIEILKPGYYPRGGGKVVLNSSPSNGLGALNLDNFGRLCNVRGISRVSNLPEHVAGRQASSAKKVLGSVLDVKVDVISEAALCPGSAITLWALTSNGCRLGASALGKRGKPAEEVGRQAGDEILSYMNFGAPVDPYFLDQVIPYAALARGRTRLSGSRYTLHAKTNIHIVKKFVDCEIEVEGDLDGPCKVTIDGVSLRGE